MRLTTLLFFFLILGMYANNGYAQKTKITLNMENNTLGEVIDHIEFTTDFKFIYKTKFVDIQRKVSVKVENETINNILEILFENTKTDFKVKDTQVILKPKKIIDVPKIANPTVVQQNIRITGMVKDQNNTPLPGATVIEKGTSNGAQTNFDGEFTLDVSDANAILSISYVGFISEEIPLDGRTNISVSLKENLESLGEVVVVGYGTQIKSDITGSVESIPQNRLEQVPNTNFTQAIQGSVPGVNIRTTGSSADGDEVSLVIRGRNSFNDDRNQPLIVLDGVPYTGNISEINPTDIESIEILKDASSAAIYGSRAANGVILITSKKGEKGKLRFNYDAWGGIESLTDFPQPLTPAEFYDFKRIRNESLLTNSEIELFENGGGTNWVDLATRSGYRQQHTLSVSGGSEKTQFYVSGSFLNVDGVAVNDQFQRTSLRVNLDVDLADWLKFGTNTQLSLADRDGQNASFGGAWRVNPLTTAFNEDGTLTVDPWPEDVQTQNPLDNTLINDNYDTYKVFTNNFFDVKLPFIKGLSFRLNTGVEYTNLTRQQYRGRDTKEGFRSQGEAELEDNIATNYLVENILNYNRSFGKHKVGLTALYSYQNIKSDVRTLDARGFPSDDLTWYQAEQAAVIEPGYDFSEQTTLSAMVRLNYNYDRRYNATFTARRDGYSGFGENEKWGTFLSGGLAWNVHNEAFMEESAFDVLKLRLSYGLNGNQAIGPYQTLTTLNSRPYLDGTTTAPGFVPDDIGNPNLRWESTLMANIAVDYALFNNRLNGSIEYYDSTTNDLLLNRTISPISGDNAITDNIGELKNRGLEIAINGDIIRTEEVKWNLGINASFLENEISELYGDGQDDIANEWFLGQPINVAYDFEFDGVYQIGEDIENSAQPEAQPGYAKIVDQNSDGEINEEDLVILGNEDPNFFVGLNTTVSYKGISLNVFAQGAFGAIRSNDFLQDDVNSDIRRNTIKKNWWTPDNPTNEFWANDEDANLLGVDIYQSIDFLRLKDVTLSYDFPQQFMNKMGLARLRLYLTGRNLATITNFTGLDPELAGTRDIPLAKSYVFGLNLSF